MEKYLLQIKTGDDKAFSSLCTSKEIAEILSSNDCCIEYYNIFKISEFGVVTKLKIEVTDDVLKVYYDEIIFKETIK